MVSDHGDYDSQMTLFTSLIKAEATAKQIDQEEQLSRRDYIGEIAEGRVKHIAKDMWKKDATLQRTVGRKISFVDFKGMIQEWIGILSTKRSSSCTSTSGRGLRSQSRSRSRNSKWLESELDIFLVGGVPHSAERV